MAEIFINNFYSYNLPLMNVYWCAVSWLRLGNVRIGWGWNIHLIHFLPCIIRLIWIGYGTRCINLFCIHPWSFNLNTQVIRSYDVFFINTITIFSTYIICLNYGTCTLISAWRKSKNVGACFTISLRNTNCERF